MGIEESAYKAICELLLFREISMETTSPVMAEALHYLAADGIVAISDGFAQPNGSAAITRRAVATKALRVTYRLTGSFGAPGLALHYVTVNWNTVSPPSWVVRGVGAGLMDGSLYLAEHQSYNAPFYQVRARAL